MNIHLDNYAIVRALALAQASLLRWQGNSGHYANTLRSHFVGRVGEIAAERHIESLGLRHVSHFYSANCEAMCDIEIVEPSIRVEVKTWSRSYWESLGRAVSVAQAKYIEDKADVIWWMVVDNVRGFGSGDLFGLSNLRCELAGWSLVSEVLAAEVVEIGMTDRETAPNYQVGVGQLHKFRPSPPTPLPVRERGEAVAVNA